MKLTAELEATGGNTTGFRVPDEFVAELGGGGRPKIVATVNGYQWRSSIARMGGEYWLGVSAANRSGAGVQAGDVLDVDVVLDTGVREVEMPEDLARALAADPAAQAFWDKLSFSNKRYHVEQITGAKTEQTRERRVAKSVQLMSQGKAR
jgi:Bacteriocin-protection, YdeI or OmpD-Associated/Domain of unknown function (DUF1905)